MHAPLFALAFFALMGQPAHESTGRVVTLPLPHALRAGEAIFLEVKVGAMEQKAEIEIEGTAGQPLGTISPFGIRAGQPAGVYTVPVPADAIANGRLVLRLFIEQSNHEERAPTAKEVGRIRVKIMPGAR